MAHAAVADTLYLLVQRAHGSRYALARKAASDGPAQHAMLAALPYGPARARIESDALASARRNGRIWITQRADRVAARSLVAANTGRSVAILVAALIVARAL